MKKHILIVLLALCLCCGLCIGAAAYGAVPCDVGNNVDYDTGGWDSGGSFDWGSDGGDNYYYGGSTDGGSSEPLSAMDWVIGGGIVVAVIVVAVLINKFKGNKTTSAGNVMPVGKPNDHTPEIVPAVQAVDPNFSEEKFIAWTKEVFITLQQAWTARDWSKIRPFEKEELFRQHEQQLQEYINNHTINVVERINVKQAYLHFYERDAQYEYMVVYLEARMNDYVVDEKTRAVLKGDPNRELHMNYLLTFMRKTGVKTNPATSNKSTVSCPHCGAPVQITSAGKCEYCDFIITTGEHDWVLSDLSSVRPDTKLDDRGVVLHEEHQ